MLTYIKKKLNNIKNKFYKIRKDRPFFLYETLPKIKRYIFYFFFDRLSLDFTEFKFFSYKFIFFIIKYTPDHKHNQIQFTIVIAKYNKTVKQIDLKWKYLEKKW